MSMFAQQPMQQTSLYSRQQLCIAYFLLQLAACQGTLHQYLEDIFQNRLGLSYSTKQFETCFKPNHLILGVTDILRKVCFQKLIQTKYFTNTRTAWSRLGRYYRQVLLNILTWLFSSRKIWHVHFLIASCARHNKKYILVP